MAQRRTHLALLPSGAELLGLLDLRTATPKRTRQQRPGPVSVRMALDGPWLHLPPPTRGGGTNLILDLAVEMFLSLVERLRRIAELRDGSKSTTWLRCRPRICDRHKTLCERDRRSRAREYAAGDVRTARWGIRTCCRLFATKQVHRSAELDFAAAARPPDYPGPHQQQHPAQGRRADWQIWPSLSLYFLGAMRWWRVEGPRGRGRGDGGRPIHAHSPPALTLE